MMEMIDSNIFVAEHGLRWLKGQDDQSIRSCEVGNASELASETMDKAILSYGTILPFI